MKRKITIALLAFILFISNIHSVSAAETKGYNSIIEYNLKKNNATDIDEWIEKGLTNEINISAEWYVMALSHMGDYDFSSYEKSLLEYIEGKNITSATTREKFALALCAIGSNSSYITEALNNSLGEQGIMSYVYGLHLINNGYKHSIYTEKDIVDKILSYELSDGGWCLRGNVADVDVTAMTIQALALYYAEDKVKSSVDRALEILSSMQLENGDFLSYGVSNPESSSQVIVALVSIGVDPLTDTRFIKNGNTLFDGIMCYQLDDGSFSHALGGDTNVNATVQAFYAFVSYKLFKNNNGIFYVFESDKNNETSTDNSENTSSTVDNIDTTESKPAKDTEIISEATSENIISNSENNFSLNNGENKSSFPTYKKVIIICIIVLSVVISALLFVLKKRNYKNYIAIIVADIVIIAIVMFINIQSKEEYYNSEISKENPIGVVYMSIDCKTIVGNSDNKYVPKDGFILPETEFRIESGDTVYDILLDASKKYSIHFENNGSDEMAYIAGINYIYEFDYGDLSGWVFRINGSDSNVGCSDYVLKDGDKIEWKYTLELGKDFQ